MPAPQTAAKPALPDANALAASFVEAQERGAATFARAYDVLAKTAQAIWENEPQLFQLEADQVMKTFTPAETTNPAAALAMQCERLHENADRVIARMRHINDLAWDCGWRIAAIYAEGLQALMAEAGSKAPAPTAVVAKAKAA
jgi:hypothetical protein